MPLSSSSRPRLAKLSFVLFGTALLSCAADPPILVHTARVGQTSELEMGKQARVDRITKPSQSGHRSGYFTIRNQTEWDLFFADVPAHPLSHDVDFGKDMVVAAYAGEPEVVSLGVQKVIDAEHGVHLYLAKVLQGEGCAAPANKPLAFDLVTIDRNEKPLHLHVDAERADACGSQRAPTAKVACRIPPATEWSERLTASLGSLVECEATVEPGQRPVVDRTLRFREIAKGSGAKVKFAQGGLSGKFTVDAIGKFVVHVEATDDGQRKGEAIATIDVAPPTADTYAEIAWSRYTPQEDLESFPRVDLHIFDTGQAAVAPPPPPEPVASSASSASSAAKPASSSAPKPVAGAKPPHVAPKPRPAPSWKDCSYESVDKPNYCQVTKWGVTTLTRLHGDTPGRYALAVRYLDERFEKGPMLCVRIFSKGTFTSEACDPATRKPGATWNVGVIDEATGQPVLPSSAPPPVPVPPEDPAPQPASSALAPATPATPKKH
jgi:hypothetical protein